MALQFKDHFSGHATAYADARPRYPTALFEWLATRTPQRDLAWDCGTGNGQAALGLADHYQRVIATDPSNEQIANAFAHARVEYRVAVESPGLESHSVDLVTVAQALHWLDRPKFYAEVKKVLKPRGVIAVWCYGRCCIEPVIDTAVQEFYSGETGPYWPPERRQIDEGYRSIEFPFVEIVPPQLNMEQHWTLNQFLAYLRTWSAVQRYFKAVGRDPVLGLEDILHPLWGDPERIKAVRWPLSVRAGKV